MPSTAETFDTIQRISAASSFDEAWTALCDGAAKLEIKMGSYAFGVPEEMQLESSKNFTLSPDALGVSKLNYDPGFLDFYEQGDFISYDTTVMWACRQTRPALWTETDRNVANGNWRGKFAELYYTSRDFGMMNGAVIPLRNRASSAMGGVVILADSELNSDQADRLLTERMASMQQMAEAFHLYRPILDITERCVGLSKRERECLQYLCQGLGQKQIAHRLNTHDRTVQKQITSSKKKLNAISMTQAVVKALAYELIEP